MKTKTFWAMVLTLSMLSATVDARDYDITAYGAKSDTTVLSTQVLQQAPDARPDFVEEDTEGWGDQGNGTYRNPVLNADFSDPDVIRVGSKYYMVASDFHFLGMQVLESDDMVNWRYVSQIYRRFDEPGWDDNGHYAGGSWAPAIRHHNGLYYVYFCTPDEGLYMSTAGLHFTTAGEPFPLRSGYWKGIRVGLFCYGKSGRAAFDEFTQKVNQ